VRGGAARLNAGLLAAFGRFINLGKHRGSEVWMPALHHAAQIGDDGTFSNVTHHPGWILSREGIGEQHQCGTIGVGLLDHSEAPARAASWVYSTI
jgi:hypothetical protein